MKLKVFQIDAFTNHIFGGNPACVVPLTEWLPDGILLKIARENAVAETAFFIEHGQTISLRWFTPDIEMDLCGHATLATAHCLKVLLERTENKFTFDTKSGSLFVTYQEDLYYLDFPSRMPVKATLPEIISNALNIQPIEVLKSRDYVLIFDNENEIRKIKIDRQKFDLINLDPGGVIVTAKGNDCDFVSRFFTPQATILEDPVTGSAHCSLIPLWSTRLEKTSMTALQLSERGGELYCEDKGERVIIAGKAKTYLEGFIWTE
jgi:PhzF family phenazine biosynthesis protein